jgi:Mrp family chromosome partitioning ATPase
MFLSEAINVPVLGIIENMAYFTPEELPDNKYYIFGQEGQNLAEDLDVPLAKFQLCNPFVKQVIMVVPQHCSQVQ